MRGYVGEGRFTNDPLNTFGGAGVVEIPQMQGLLRYICENGFEHHVAANLSQMPARSMKQPAITLTGICTFTHPRGSRRMAIVAGVDFGTLSVRVSIFDSERGRLATAAAEYPLHRKREDPDHATQSHADQMDALVKAAHQAIAEAGVAGDSIAAIALDTTGSSVVAVDANMQPLGEYYLWCDHRAKSEAAGNHPARPPAKD